jgi:hypothetical protein
MSERPPLDPESVTPSAVGPSSEESYKCSNCGTSFPVGEGTQAKCPTCGKTCTRETCQVVVTSNQGY